MEKLKELGSLFYIVNPYESMFEQVSDIPTPDWVAKVIVHCTKRKSPNVGICWRSITHFMFYKYFSSTHNVRLKILCIGQLLENLKHPNIPVIFSKSKQHSFSAY